MIEKNLDIRCFLELIKKDTIEPTTVDSVYELSPGVSNLISLSFERLAVIPFREHHMLEIPPRASHLCSFHESFDHA